MWANVNIGAERGIPGAHFQPAYFPVATTGIGGASSSGHAAQKIDIGGGRANVRNCRAPANTGIASNSSLFNIGTYFINCTLRRQNYSHL